LKHTSSVLIFSCAFVLSGCFAPMSKYIGDPEISPLGSDLTTSSTETDGLSEVLAPDESTHDASNWLGGPADYFRGQRATSKGDLVTIRISLNDRAVFNNSSSRTRKAKADAGGDFDVGIFGLLGAGAAEANAGSNSSMSGQGNITRSEKLDVTLTAIVTKVYKNGMLHIEGTQQAMVNRERRDVRIAGIVNPRDIDETNSIDFSKIAEARVVYGGAGKVSDVQKSGWGLQLWDKVNPF
jgi:flagellar L-ring protein FlgH